MFAGLESLFCPFCAFVDCFEKIEQIGEGTYGQVYMAKEKATGEIVALKKVRMDNEKEGFPITAIREIKILKKLQHENVIKLKEIVTSKGPEKDDNGKSGDSNKFKGSIFLVFEYMDHDLTGLSDRPGMHFTIPQIKCYMKQLLTGLHYCHVNQVLHRDIKGSNLLIDNNGNLKLADFGLARSFSNEQPLTNRVITLWYRPPELLLGSTRYSPAVDMWSVGCIFAELLHGKPILPGKHESEQLAKIWDLCGSPDEVNWPGVSRLQLYNQLKPERHKHRRVKDVFKHFDWHALDLLERMLTLDPLQRITARDALDTEYFWTDPFPCSPSSLPKYEASHEFQTKKKRQQQRQQQEEAAKRQKTMNHPPCHVHVSSLPALPLHHVPAHATHNTGLSPHVTIPVNQHYRVGNISRGGNPGHHPTGVRAHYGGPGQVVGYGPNHGQAITVYGCPPPLPQPAGYSAPGIMQVGRGGYGAGYTSTLVYGGIGGQGPAISVHGQQFGYIYPALSGIIALDVRVLNPTLQPTSFARQPYMPQPAQYVDVDARPRAHASHTGFAIPLPSSPHNYHPQQR
ncbi:unnamed protein product [Sphagnum troendelagicum]|uniref:Protein kinase domain-containing protein n=1 Tax=Sphagnum troendelagicum TaxID=128251 RepID=A0ABP0TV27_9BRYO